MLKVMKDLVLSWGYKGVGARGNEGFGIELGGNERSCWC